MEVQTKGWGVVKPYDLVSKCNSDVNSLTLSLWQLLSNSTHIYWRNRWLPTSARCLLKTFNIHQHNVKWFQSYNWTTQQLWKATLIFPDTSRCSQIGWMQSNVLSGALRLLHWCSSMFWMLWNRIQEYPEECIVALNILKYQTIRRFKFRSDCKYWLHLQDKSGGPQTWSHTLRE